MGCSSVDPNPDREARLEAFKAKTEKLVAQMRNDLGFSVPWRDMLAELDPEFMDLFHRSFKHVHQKRQALPAKYKEIVACCLDAMAFHQLGFKVHARKALEAGATVDEVLEALEMCSLMGIRTLGEHLPALVEEAEKLKGK